VEVVDGLLAALPRPVADVDPRLLHKAAGPGRVRAAALDLYAEALAHPRGADRVLRRGLRAARHLHSRERRLVADGVNDLLRFAAALAAALDTTEPSAAWLGWLVLHGLPPEAAGAAWGDDPPPLARVTDLAGALAESLRGLSAAEAVACAGSVSTALGAALAESLGDATGAFLAASAERPLAVLRATGIAREDLAARLVAEGIATTPTRLAPDGLVVQGRANLAGTRAWRDGLFILQDEGSQLVAEAVDARGVVVDFCAGAGGKTLALAQAPDVERLVASDVREAPLATLRRRAGADRTPETVRLPEDGPLPAPLDALRGGADRVLVDAPCTGTGVLRRHPAYRLRLDAAEVARLPPLQGAILDRAAPLVRPGGRLIYATCSVLRAEDDAVVDAFLDRHPRFARVPLGAVLPEADGLGGDLLRVAPHTHGTDGFFAAVLELSAGPT